MTWQIAVALGAAGGLLVEAINIFGRLTAWQTARQVAQAEGRRLPSLARYLDPMPHLWLALTRTALGAIAGGVLHTQIVGSAAAIAVGAAAPVLLTQLGAIPAIQREVRGAQRPTTSATLPPQDAARDTVSGLDEVQR